MVVAVKTSCLNRSQSSAVPRGVLKGCVWLFHRRVTGRTVWTTDQTAVSNAEALLLCEAGTEYVCVVTVTPRASQCAPVSVQLLLHCNKAQEPIKFYETVCGCIPALCRSEAAFVFCFMAYRIVCVIG